MSVCPPCVITILLALVMRTHYPDQIKETEQELEQLERSLRGQSLYDRVKMLRLLKTGTYDSRRTLAPVLGYSERQLQRWWKMYKKGGLDALLDEKPVGGSTERMTDEAWNALREKMRDGTVKQLKEAQAFLIDHFDIEYTSLQGLSDMIKRRSIADLMVERSSAKPEAQAPSSPRPPASPSITAGNPKAGTSHATSSTPATPPTSPTPAWLSL